MQLAAHCKKRKTKKASVSRKHNNMLYKKRQKRFFNTLKIGKNEETIIINPPPENDVESFWGGILSSNSKHNNEATWLQDEEKEMSSKKQAEWSDITMADLQLTTKRLSNWKAPGIDQVQNCWLKDITALHPLMLELFDHTMKKPTTMPKWMTGGRTMLGETTIANNYQPITCLPTTYKLLILILTDKFYNHLTEENILPIEQKSIRRKIRGCKDHLMIDKIISEDAKRKNRKFV